MKILLLTVACPTFWSFVADNLQSVFNFFLGLNRYQIGAFISAIALIFTIIFSLLSILLFQETRHDKREWYWFVGASIVALVVIFLLVNCLGYCVTMSRCIK